MARIMITGKGVMIDGHWVPASQVHLDIDCKTHTARAQLVLELDERDVVVDIPASVRLINDENPRTQQVDITPDPLLQAFTPTGSKRCEIP